MADFSLISSLSHRFDSVIRDPVWGDIHFDNPLYELATGSALGQLDGIRQLGPVASVYPGATHTRRSHSLGVYYIARRLVLSLVERGQIDFASRGGLRAFLAAALLHDLGHFPFAHSLKELPLRRHEALAGDLAADEPLREALEYAQIDPEQVAAIIDPERDGNSDRETKLYRRLLSGVLDPDKIDYLTRDAYFCGVPYGIQDADYIVRRVFVDGGELVVDERGEMSVEAVLFSKYQMYRAVYWHPTVRSATATVKKAVFLALRDGELDPENLYGIDDAGFAALVRGSSTPCLEPARSVLEGRLYAKVAEFRFDAGNPVHRDLGDLEVRTEAEAALALAANLDETDLVIDIPEPVHFESELKVRSSSGLRSFENGRGLFGSGSIADLEQSLRIIRVFARSSEGITKLAPLAGELLEV